MSINPITPKSMTNDLKVNSLDKQPRISDLLPDTPNHNKSLVLLGLYLNELNVHIYDKGYIELMISEIEFVLGKLNKILDEYKMVEIVQKLRYLVDKIYDVDYSFQEKLHERSKYAKKVKDEILEILPVKEKISFIQGALLSEIAADVLYAKTKSNSLLIAGTDRYVDLLKKIGRHRSIEHRYYDSVYVREKLYSVADKLRRYKNDPNKKILDEIEGILAQIQKTYEDEAFRPKRSPNK